MATIIASIGTLTTLKEFVGAHQFRRPVLCIMKMKGPDLVRNSAGAAVWVGGAGSGWGVMVNEWEHMIGLPFQPESWHGLELLCDYPTTSNMQLFLGMRDGEFYVEETTI